MRARPVAPSPTRLASHRRVERGPGLPIAARGLLVVAVVALVAAVAWIGSGGIGPVMAGLSNALSGMVSRISATPSPSVATPEPVSDAPTIVRPETPYTRNETISVTVTVPRDVSGSADHVVRLWVTLPDEEPLIVDEVEIGITPSVVFPEVPLAKGRNTFHATIVGPTTESDASEPVAWVLDRAKPTITITTPRVDGVVINRAVLELAGKTQGRSTVVARNEANGVSGTTEAGGDGLFVVPIALAPGVNGINVKVTDPAGNTASTVVTVTRGSGKVQVSLTASAYRFKVTRLPDPVEFTLRITDPDGRPLPDALVLFTITIPGLEPIVSSELPTGGDGTAVFRTEIPRGASPGGGLVSVLVTAEDFGTFTDREVLTVVK